MIIYLSNKLICNLHFVWNIFFTGCTRITSVYPMILDRAVEIVATLNLRGAGISPSNLPDITCSLEPTNPEKQGDKVDRFYGWFVYYEWSKRQSKYSFYKTRREHSFKFQQQLYKCIQYTHVLALKFTPNKQTWIDPLYSTHRTWNCQGRFCVICSWWLWEREIFDSSDRVTEICYLTYGNHIFYTDI